MNVIIEGMYLNGFAKPEYKDKNTGETFQGDYVVQMQQQALLANGEMKMTYYDIPLDRSYETQFIEKKVGDEVRVPCNVYGENFAQIKISKAK